MPTQIPTASGILIHCAHDGLVPTCNLKPHPQNPNQHPLKQLQLLGKIIRHTGWRRPIVVSARSGYVVAGHGALEAAKLEGWAMVPVNRQDFATEADELAHMIADNRLAEESERDDVTLKQLLADLATQDIDLELTGYDQEAMDALLAEAEAAAPTPEPQEQDTAHSLSFGGIKIPLTDIELGLLTRRAASHLQQYGNHAGFVARLMNDAA